MSVITKYVLFLSATALCTYLVLHDLFVGHHTQTMLKHLGLLLAAVFVDIKYLWGKDMSSLFSNDDDEITSC